MTNEASVKLSAYTGIGRRKTSVARVGISETTEKTSFFINGQPASHYLCANPTLLAKVCAPLDLLGVENTFSINAVVNGGGLTGQTDAIQLGLARALKQLSPKYQPLLRSEGLLTRDSRRVERKKYGLKKARKAPQFSKR
uniref:Small ribosomal subunit protein uS9c n=1 Tax=Prasinoderma coloniale TaxID=156133 RepID=A0A088CIA8_9VIRI|nr:ribosomal protein S9 [Prasinoderma coloniale]AID67570.1 ribosomal protein S9 [Prasinoderma coloniale]